MSDEKTQIDKFDGQDYGFWRLQIEDIIYAKELDIVLKGKPDSLTEEEFVRLDRRAMSIVRLTLIRDVAFNTTRAKSTKEMLQILANMYEKPTAANKVYLVRKLCNLKMNESTPMHTHLNAFNRITQQLAAVNFELDDEMKAVFLLSSLPESWNPIVTAVSSSNGTTPMKYDHVRDLILSEDARKKNEPSGNNSALLTRGRSQYRGKASRGRSKSRGKSRDTSRVKCWNCGKFGHYQSNCRAPKKEKEETGTIHATTEEVADALMLTVHSQEEQWIVDTGASFHSTNKSSGMLSYVAKDFGFVYTADGSPLKVVGMGSVTIQTTTGHLWKLHNVRHIPGSVRNLISVGQLDDDGYYTQFGDGKWKVSRGALTIARGLKSGTLYVTNPDFSNVTFAGVLEDARLWHDRMGHISDKGLKLMHDKGLIPKLSNPEIGTCEHCIYGKQKRVTFSSGRQLKTQKLELVHSDLWGPAPTTSLGGALYYITFIDDSTRKVWVYFLKRKSEAFDAFRRWKSLVETETGLKLKCLRSDNGGEYEVFKPYCAEQGIRLEKTVPGTPQQNGVAERMNRTLNERARCMRLKSGLPETFWAEAINTAAHLINRGPSVPLDFGIPEEK